MFAESVTKWRSIARFYLNICFRDKYGRNSAVFWYTNFLIHYKGHLKLILTNIVTFMAKWRIPPVTDFFEKRITYLRNL